MKRDDLISLALGGNKTRKLEYILADAVAQDADTIVRAGASQFNHCLFEQIGSGFITPNIILGDHAGHDIIAVRGNAQMYFAPNAALG